MDKTASHVFKRRAATRIFDNDPVRGMNPTAPSQKVRRVGTRPLPMEDPVPNKLFQKYLLTSPEFGATTTL